ncbi:MAG: beta-mannanase [Kitasatospora sp.]|nr:beta-mannanase [Kitasatospora sp.]
MNPTRRARTTACLLLAGVLMLLPGCDRPGPSNGGDAFGSGDTQVASAAPSSQAPVDLTPLLQPAKKYIGVALDGAPASMEPVQKYTEMVGKQPNVIENYAGWGDQFDSTGVRLTWQNGALPYIAWEPHKTPLADIAKGDSDAYIKAFATAVQKTNVPVAISFAHEMNGHWYDWGTKTNSPEDFVAAWHRIHDIFQDRGASNVIWVWSPNIVNPVQQVALQPYYPGDGYVDWVGMVGYWTECCDKDFEQVYGPTMTQVRKFSGKPFIISETAAEPGKKASSFVDQLFAGVEAHPDVLGFVWFNISKRADWRLEKTPSSLKAFKEHAADPQYGFDPRKP